MSLLSDPEPSLRCSNSVKSLTVSSSLTPLQVRNTVTLSQEDTLFIQHAQKTIANILSSPTRSQLILIVGPCALQSFDSAIEYAHKLIQLQKQVHTSFFIVMRAYFEKARSLDGWKGVVHSPCQYTEKSTGQEDTLISTRRLLHELTKLRLPLAAEFLDPIAYSYFSDIISWGSIGARTIYSQPHRIMASCLPMPCGMKNSIEGSVDAACQAIKVANQTHQFLGIDLDGRICSMTSKGNPYAHLVLRGSIISPNYSVDDISDAEKRLRLLGVLPSIIIDCSHGNSQKEYKKQPAVFNDVLKSYLQKKTPAVSGLMLESFHMSGTIADKDISTMSSDEADKIQKYTSHVDACLDWQTTHDLILQAHDFFSFRKNTR